MQNSGSEIATPQPRLPLQLEVGFRKSYGRSESRGVLKNISLSGAFLEFETQGCRAGDKLQMTFEVGGRVRKIPAVIIWVRASGCGIRFQPTNKRDIQIVDDLMYFVETSRESRRSLLDDIIKRAG